MARNLRRNARRSWRAWSGGREIGRAFLNWVLDRGEEWPVSRLCVDLCRHNHPWLQKRARHGKFQQIVNGADQRPFAVHLGQTAPQKLAKAARLLDLSKYRLDHLFAQPIG